MPGLENEIASLGVSPKQVGTARQVFQRTAEQAGFFRRGRNRLTKPDVGATPRRPDLNASRPGGAVEARSTAEILEALWFTLLRDGASWDAQRVKAYVDGARSVYGALSAEK